MSEEINAKRKELRRQLRANIGELFQPFNSYGLDVHIPYACIDTNAAMLRDVITTACSVAISHAEQFHRDMSELEKEKE